MGMRYLYADSEPFPYTYDFLAVLEGFLRCAGMVLHGVVELERLQQERSTREEQTMRTVYTLETFADSISNAIEVAKTRAGSDPIVADVAEKARAFVTNTVKQAQSDRQREKQRGDAETEQRLHNVRNHVTEAVGEFFLNFARDADSSRFRLQLDSACYRMLATCRLPGGVEVTYRLGTEMMEHWQKPRRISEFVGDRMELQVGMKKKFLRRDLTREIVRVDEHVISAAELEGERAEIHLRRKPDVDFDDIVLCLQRGEGGMSCEIHRSSEKDEASTFPAVPDDLDKLQLLWAGLQDASGEALGNKERVQSVRLDGEAIVDPEVAMRFVQRYVELYAPVVDEIARRSPTDKELSLKLEHEDGRREEIYRRKADLAAHVSMLDGRRLKLLERLDVFPSVDVDVET